MFRLFLLTSAILVSANVATAPLQTQESAQRAPSVAVVDLDILFIESTFGKALQTEIATLEEQTRTKLESMAKEVNDLEANLDPSDQSAVRAAQRKREDLEIDARRVRENAQRTAAGAERRQREAFEEKMQSVLGELQQERGYDLILNKSAGAVIFAGASIDITQELVARIAG